MTQAELLDALARAIDAPRHDGRHKKIKLAFAALAEHREMNWWTRLAFKIGILSTTSSPCIL